MFQLESAEIYIPDAVSVDQALARTTHLCLAAHQDDIEIMASAPIISCFQQPDKWFTGVVVTDGRGSPRDGLYKDYSDEEMRLVRFKEQRKAAFIGEYAAQIMLDHPSKIIKDASLCGLGQTAPNPVLTTLKYFREEYESHIRDKKCKAGVCKNLFIYEIDEDACTGCTSCARKCPQDAITGDKKEPHVLDQDKCIKCGICYDACKFNAIVIK